MYVRMCIQVDHGVDFKVWKDQLMFYCTLSGLAEESAEAKVQQIYYGHTCCLIRKPCSHTSEFHP